MTLTILFTADVNEDEWQDVDDGASVDSGEDETEEDVVQQDVDMVRTLVIHNVEFCKTLLKNFRL